MTAYISVSIDKRKSLEKELNAITDTLAFFNITPFVFVDHYHFDAMQEKQMMQQAMGDLNRCDILIAETSHKAIGIGIEAGYAKAKGKPVIYLRQLNAEHSSTLSGISDFHIIYSGTDDLQKELANVLEKIVLKSQAH